MGKEIKKGINVKPDKTCWDLLFGGGGAGREGNFPEQVPQCKLELVIFIGTVKIVTHHRKVSKRN